MRINTFVESDAEIRVRIESLRQQQAQVSTPKQIKQDMDENNKEAIIASLKRKMRISKKKIKSCENNLSFPMRRSIKGFERMSVTLFNYYENSSSVVQR